MASKNVDVFSSSRRGFIVSAAASLAALTGCSFDHPTSSASLTSPTVPHTITPTPTAIPVQGTTYIVYTGHGAPVMDLAWSPDSALIYSSRSARFHSSQGSSPSGPAIHVWDALTGKNKTLAQNFNGYAPIALSPNGKLLASSELSDDSGTNWATISDASTGKLISSFQNANTDISQLSWSADSSRLAVAGLRDVEICTASTGKKLLTYPTSLSADMTQQSLVAAWAPDGSIIASAAAHEGHSLQFWDASTARPLYYFNGSMCSVAAWSPDRTMLAVDQLLIPQVLDATTGRLLLDTQAHLSLTPGFEQTFNGHIHPHALAWSPDGKYIAFADNQKQVQIWDVKNQKQAYTYTGHSDLVMAIGWSPDGSRLASASIDKTVRIWQAL